MISRFRECEFGGVATVFAITLAVGAVVLAAAGNLPKTDEERVTTGKAHFKSAVNIPKPPDAGFAIGSDAVSGEVDYTVPTAFMDIVGYKTVEVRVTAEAQLGGKDVPCILLLEPKEIALTINGHSQLKANCGVHVNSKNTEAIYVNSNSKITATSVCVTGGYRLNGGSTSAPTPQKNCPVNPDPLAGFPEPFYGGCSFTDLVVDGGQTICVDEVGAAGSP